MSMRDIKFRAWFYELSIMCDVLDIQFEGDACYIWDEKTDKSWDVSLKEVDLMQFTGLQDKNGTDIYEGDYIRDKVVVKWNPLHCCFGWYRNGGYVKPLRAELYDKSGKTPKHWFINEEVIGNIHESD